MKSEKLFLIIAIPVIALVLAFVLFLVFALELLMVNRGEFNRIDIWYLIDKDEKAYRKLAPKHSLAKFSKIKMETKYDEMVELAGKPTGFMLLSGGTYYNLGYGWVIIRQQSEIRISDNSGGRRFGLEHNDCGTILRAVAQSGDSGGAGAFTDIHAGKPKHSLAKFTKIKIGMSPAEVFKLAGKPTDSVGTEYIWHRYKLDTGWYMNLYFHNEKLGDMAIEDSPNKRIFELEPDDYTATPSYLRAVAQSSGKSGAGTFTDGRDGKAYRTAKIGKFTWMAQNLNFVTDSSRCYDNADSNCTKYGRMYTWNDAMEACPAPWRLPDTCEWWDLVTAAGGRRAAGTTLKSATGWREGRPGTDDFGFSALPGGRYESKSEYWGSYFWGIGETGYWWSATEDVDEGEGSATYAISTVIYVFRDDNSMSLGRSPKTNRYSVRCVEEAADLR